MRLFAAPLFAAIAIFVTTAAAQEITAPGAEAAQPVTQGNLDELIRIPGRRRDADGIARPSAPARRRGLGGTLGCRGVRASDGTADGVNRPDDRSADSRIHSQCGGKVLPKA